MASTQTPPKISDPDLFEKSVDAARQALQVYGPVEDREAAERVRRIGYELAAHSPYRDMPFTFHLV
ncbi:MAG: hypothetical protein AAGD38_00505, partial [Acidobacteriota bacterium]